MNDPRGSMWARWDLHIHSPASYNWNGPNFPLDAAGRKKVLDDMVAALNASTAQAFAIMDYWTVDGWLALRQHLAGDPSVLTKKVFPGIELRLEAPTDFKLNTHFLFDDELSDQQLKEFIGNLELAVIRRPPSPEAFRELALQYDDGKLKTHGFGSADRSDEMKMQRLGMMTAKVSRDSWRAAREKMNDRVLVIQPYDTNDGLENLDWKRHPYDDLQLMRAADYFETRNPVHVRLFLGAGYPKKPQVAADFFKTLGGRWRPVVSGSDAHRFTDYGVFPENKESWLKADTTFAGLKQCAVDPIGRVFVGPQPPKVTHFQNNPTKYVVGLVVRKLPGSTFAENWFDCDLQLNPGMIAIIGNKGGGKSALADIIALAGNSHCKAFEFLNDRRFCKPSDNRAIHFEVILTWANGDQESVSLAARPRFDQPERVRYMPQQYLEELCSEVGTEGQSIFERELRKVVFSHVPSHQRLGFATLDDVVQYRTEQSEELAKERRKTLSAINASLFALEKDSRPENLAAIQSEIQLREKELESLLSQRPLPIARPDTTTVDPDVRSKIDTVRSDISAKQAELERLQGTLAVYGTSHAAGERLSQRLINLKSHITRVSEEAAIDAKLAGIDLKDVLEFKIALEPVQNRIKELQSAISKDSIALRSRNEEIEVLQLELDELSERASEPERKFQAYLADLDAWNARHTSLLGDKKKVGSLEHLRFRLSSLQKEAKGRIAELTKERESVAQTLFELVQRQLDVYRELYEPVAKTAAKYTFIRDHLGLEFNVVIDAESFADRFLAQINQGRRGTFYGHIEGTIAARALVRNTSFGKWEDVKSFLESVEKAIRIDTRDKKGEQVSIESQLRDNHSVPNLLDFIFGLSYLRPRLTLELSGKEIAELSPGERGILLLVFYLLLDQEEIPLIIDQPEHNLDNASVFRLLEPCIRHAKNRRQIMLVTHNANVAIVCDAEQVISAEIDKADGYRITYRAGAIENPTLNLDAVNVLEGTWPAFIARDAAYQRLPIG